MLSAFALAAALMAADGPAPTIRPFAITVVDEATGRGVPLVELKTVNEVRYVTDSAGVAAVLEPGLSGRKVFFHVKAHGYEYPKDGFGYRGKALDYVDGGAATLRVTRRNIAERLYRVTGAGIYRDSLLAGRTPPTRQPVLDAEVFGSDSVLNAIYQGKLHWFWGDTNRPGYPLGNFHVPGATSVLPGQGGLDPETGVDLDYFTAPSGFAAETAHLPGNGPTWLGGLVAFRDASGQERLVAGYAKIRPPLETYEHGLVAFNPADHRFEKVATFPLDAPLRPTGHTYLARDGDIDYVYFTTPFPLTRVRADLAHLSDVKTYEAYTCLETGSRLPKDKDKTAPRIDRGADGRVRYAWRADTPALGPADFARLVKDGHLKPDEALLALRDVETGKAVTAHGGTVNWNAHRKRWVLVCVEVFGTSLLGEIWYAEADHPLGPWVHARKVVSHDKYSLYNPRQHPYFDKDGGRTIFFEGTYTTSFSGSTDPTPRYEYNQIMYKLDLDDPRLNLPVLVSGTLGRCFALERPGEGTVPVFVVPGKEGTKRLRAGGGAADERPAFHAWPADRKDPPRAVAPLFEFVADDDQRRVYSTDPTGPGPGFRKVEPPVCLVWPSPTRVQPAPAPERLP